MRLHSILHGSRANGPGLRTVVWVQGCVNMGPEGAGNCPGCHNPLTWDPDGGTEVDTRELAYQILRDMPEGTDGITISGGEPIQSAKDVFALIRTIKANRPNLSIGMFTGYTMAELAWIQVNHTSVVQYIHWWMDFVVSGRYDRTRPTLDEDLRNRLCSSTNQRLYLFSPRYTYDDFPPLLSEVIIDETGLTQITGF